jgi:hypothetical protein
MPTAPIIEQPPDADIAEEILRDPKVQAALDRLDNSEDREDLICALMVSRRIKEGKEPTHTLEEVVEKLGL